MRDVELEKLETEREELLFLRSQHDASMARAREAGETLSDEFVEASTAVRTRLTCVEMALTCKRQTKSYGSCPAEWEEYDEDEDEGWDEWYEGSGI